jgi:hypothetical protein
VGEWHVIDQERQQPKAFNWPADPRESRDLASRPDVDAIVRRVLSLFK